MLGFKVIYTVQLIYPLCKLFFADLEKPQEAVDMIEKVLVEFPELDLLVNNASVFDVSPF